MQEIIKLRSRKDDLHYESEQECSNRLIMIKPMQSPIVDKMACLFNRSLYKDIFPFTIDSRLAYRVSTKNPQFVDLSGGPFLEKGIVLDETKFFKTKVTKPNDSQKYGCERGECVKKDNDEEEVEYVEPNKQIVDIIYIDGAGSVIFLKDEKNEDRQ